MWFRLCGTFLQNSWVDYSQYIYALVIVVNIVNVLSTGVGIGWGRVKMRLIRMVKFCYLCVFKLMWFFCHVFHKGCEEGYFGTECSQVCGLCRNTVDCHHVNGTCLTGCKSGYIGHMCKTRKCVKAVWIFKIDVNYWRFILRQ